MIPEGKSVSKITVSFETQYEILTRLFLYTASDDVSFDQQIEDLTKNVVGISPWKETWKLIKEFHPAHHSRFQSIISETASFEIEVDLKGPYKGIFYSSGSKVTIKVDNIFSSYLKGTFIEYFELDNNIINETGHDDVFNDPFNVEKN